MDALQRVKENELIVVYAGNPIDAGFLQSLLEAEGITTFLKDEVIGTIAPFYVAAGGVGAVKVVIPQKELGKAKPIVGKFSTKRT